MVETWSGNLRMLGCARKLGFVEVKRQEGAYIVDGKAYDGLVLEKRLEGTAGGAVCRAGS